MIWFYIKFFAILAFFTPIVQLIATLIYLPRYKSGELTFTFNPLTQPPVRLLITIMAYIPVIIYNGIYNDLEVFTSASSFYNQDILCLISGFDIFCWCRLIYLYFKE